jgi:hypothetical protein
MGVPDKLNPKGVKRIKDWQENNPNKKLTTKSAEVPVDDPPTRFTNAKRPHNDVWEVDIEELRFNPFNGRLGDWGPNTAVKYDQDKKALREKIQHYMLDNPDFSPTEAGELKGQLRRDGQTEPAVALADGTLIDGNTRLAALMDLNRPTMNVFFLPKEFPLLDAEAVEGFFSHEPEFVKGWNEYQRALDVMRKVRREAGAGVKGTPSEKEMERAMGHNRLKQYLEVVGLGASARGKDKGKHTKAIKLCRGVMAAETFVTRYNAVLPIKDKKDKNWLNDKREGGPGFTVFTSDILKTIELGHNSNAQQKIRQMIHSKLKTYAEGTQHDDENRITGVIRTLYRAIDKDPDFVDDVSISATTWHTGKTATALDEEISDTLKQVKTTKKQTAMATKLQKILGKMNQIKDKDLKKANKGKVKPIVKKIYEKAQHLRDKTK